MKRQHQYDQHFLRSPRLVAELIGHTNIRKNDTVYDLGAGSGVISYTLSRRAKQVVAVENEPSALEILRKNLRRNDNVDVVQADIMSVRFPREGNYKIFSNIPFSLSSELVSYLTSLPNPPKSIYLIVQKQFARKLLTDGKSFTSQLGMGIAPWWSARIRRPLNKTDFTPPPAVDTVLFELKPNETPPLPASERDEYERFVKRCFDDTKYFKSLLPSAPRPSFMSGKDMIDLYRSKAD